MANLSLRQVKKNFGKTEVIHGISVDISDGEFIVIVGPSGCGKSTLLRMVAGLESISSGEILIDETRVNEKEPMDRDIAMVFQNYALYPHMTVRQNMAYGLKIAKTPKDEIQHKVDEAAKLLQLENFLNRKPRELSGGQRQRVAMGRAIVREPAVFLFDEPLSNLDAKLRVQMRLEIKELQLKLGVTALYVTHDQTEAMTMADRMIVMNDGRAEQVGTPLQVYERPQTLFAAQFIGSPSMNVLNGRIESGRLFVENSIELPLSAEHSGLNGNVMVGIRPEHLVLQSDPPPNQYGMIEIEHGFTEPLGATTLLHGRMASSGTALTASLPGVYQPTTMKTNQFAVPPEHIHLFNTDTGERL